MKNVYLRFRAGNMFKLGWFLACFSSRNVFNNEMFFFYIKSIEKVLKFKGMLLN